MRVLVTGASGFVGKAACAELAARGHTPVALVRRAGSQPDGVEAVPGDLGQDLKGPFAQAAPDAVLHLAAEIASQRSEEKIHAVNVDGTQRVLDACAALATPPRLVFASTVVTGEAHGKLLTEKTALPVETPYGRSKQEGERMVLGSGLPACVVRPSHVYGPGGWYAEEIVSRLRSPGRFALIGSGENLWDVVHVDDVASALVDAAERAPDGETFHCADDEPLTMRAFFDLTTDALGIGPARSIPVWAAKLAAGPNTARALTRSARSSNVKLKSVLGWTPRFPSARDGVPAAIAGLAA